MRSPKMILPAWLLTSALLLMPWTPASGQQNPQSTGESVIFSVWKDAQGTARMVPIVMIDGTKYTSPPIWGKNPIATGKFIDSYFRTGRQYRVIFGGGDAGSLTVQKYIPDDCNNLEVEVGVQTTARLGGGVPALAVSSDKIGRGASSRRAPTEGEHRAAEEVARAAYNQRGVANYAVLLTKTVSLTATDIDRDGKFELIGSFEADDAILKVRHNLFIIFDSAGAGKYKSAWNSYQKGNEQEYSTLVALVDLDGDGTAEVVLEQGDDEGYQFSIHKRQAGTWGQFYVGGGAGLC